MPLQLCVCERWLLERSDLEASNIDLIRAKETNSSVGEVAVIVSLNHHRSVHDEFEMIPFRFHAIQVPMKELARVVLRHTATLDEHRVLHDLLGVPYPSGLEPPGERKRIKYQPGLNFKTRPGYRPDRF